MKKILLLFLVISPLCAAMNKQTNNKSKKTHKKISKTQKNQEPNQNKDEPSHSEKNKSTVNPYEPYQKELSTYLKELNLDGITTKQTFKTYLLTSLERDEAKFSLCNTFMKELQDKNDKKTSDEFVAALEAILDKFVKPKEASLIDDE
jgi:hypothetical protein